MARQYVDIERLLVGWLHAHLAVRCSTDLPADLAGALPILQVGRIGGPDTARGVDAPMIDIECYAADRSSAYTLAEQARNSLRYVLPGTNVNGTYVARVDTVSGPAQRPYDNTNVTRYVATYTLHLQF
jgi:hypothetical protein